MAERYGSELAGALPEATVLGFDDYADDRRPARRRPHRPPAGAAHPARPPHAAADQPGASAPPPTTRGRTRRRSPGTTGCAASGWRPARSAALKLASGCDRRCAFCAIPTFRGAFVSRPAGRGARRGAVAGRPGRDRAGAGQRELHLLRQGPRRPAVAGEAAAAAGRDRGHRPGAGGLPAAGRAAARACSRSSPATDGDRAVLRPVLPALLAGAAAPDAPLRRHRRLPRADRAGPRPGARRPASAPTSSSASPGETEDDVAELERFLTEGRLDAVGVFGYSDEEGTEADRLPGKLDQDEIDARVRRITDLVEELTAQRAEDRDRRAGRGAAHRGPRRGRRRRELDRARRPPGPRRRRHDDGRRRARRAPSPGELVAAEVVGTEGVDLVARAVVPALPAGGDRDERRPGRSPPRRPARLVNLPNALTVLRLAVVPVFAVLLLQDGRAGRPPAAGGRAASSSPAILTDRYDGMIARRTGQVTEFGKLADPIADKALTGMALIGLSVLGLLPWWVTVVILVRELGVTLLRVLGDPARRDRGQPGRQAQDRRPVAGDRALHPAADRAAGHGVRWWVMAVGRWCSPSSPGSTTSYRALTLRRTSARAMKAAAARRSAAAPRGFHGTRPTPPPDRAPGRGPARLQPRSGNGRGRRSVTPERTRPRVGQLPGRGAAYRERTAPAQGAVASRARRTGDGHDAAAYPAREHPAGSPAASATHAARRLRCRPGQPRLPLRGRARPEGGVLRAARLDLRRPRRSSWPTCWPR